MGLQMFLSEGHLSCYRTIRGPDILGNVIVLGYVTFYRSNKSFVCIWFFHFINKPSLRPDEMASRIRFGLWVQ